MPSPGQDKSSKERIIAEQWKTGFDFAAFKEAFEGKDLDRWVPFYADDAEWTEYRHLSPPRAPNRMIGKQQIAEFLARVCGADFGVSVADEVVTADRVAFSVDCVFPDGNRIFEHVITHIEDGKIVRQVDVEAWD
jgi:ketosteroid isomerase-like protein